MGRKLARAVVVGLNAYPPGTDEKDMGDDAELVTNPKAWGEDTRDEGDEQVVRAILPDTTPIPTDDENINGEEGEATATPKKTRGATRGSRSGNSE